MRRGRTPDLLIALWCVAILAACGPEPPPQEGLLPRGTFKEVLLQAQLLEAEAGFDQVFDTTDSAGVEQRYDTLFAKHTVSREAFEKTFHHYAQRPEELKAIYEEILTDLAKRRDSVR